MPIRPPSYCPRCRSIGCSPACRKNKEAERARYRERHDRTRPNAAARGYGAEWRELRTKILRRDPFCMKCRAEPSTDVDHIVPKARGGSDHPSNLQGLCKPCHSRKTARWDGGYGNRLNGAAR